MVNKHAKQSFVEVLLPKTKTRLMYLPNENFIMDLPETGKNLVGIFVAPYNNGSFYESDIK